jgi:hypothetical protein
VPSAYASGLGLYARTVSTDSAVEQAGHAGALDRDVEHVRVAVRQDRERRAQFGARSRRSAGTVSG